MSGEIYLGAYRPYRPCRPCRRGRRDRPYLPHARGAGGFRLGVETRPSEGIEFMLVPGGMPPIPPMPGGMPPIPPIPGGMPWLVVVPRNVAKSRRTEVERIVCVWFELGDELDMVVVSVAAMN